MRHSNELTKIKSLVSESVWELFKECDVIIAGGTITSVFCNREVNDIDVYVRSEDDFFKFISMIYEGNDFKLIASNMTNRSILFYDKETKQDVQLIIYKFFPDVNAIFNNYDFTVNMGALNCGSELFQFHDDFFKHNSQRYLQFHTGTAYPLISALRVQKYVEKGYTISKAQMLRLLLTITKLNIMSWDELKDNIGGMYGLNMDEVFPETEEFSLEKSIEILDEVISDKKFITKYESISYHQIVDKHFSEYDDKRISATGIFFKNVTVDKDGRYLSAYNSKFEYKLGESVDGGKEGVYCYTGYDVISGIYNKYPANCILELECLTSNPSKNTIGDGNKYQLFGDVKVKAVYTHVDFIRKFKKGNEPTPKSNTTDVTNLFNKVLSGV